MTSWRSGVALPPPPQPGHGILPVPRQELQPTSPSDQRVHTHSVKPVPSHRGHSGSWLSVSSTCEQIVDSQQSPRGFASACKVACSSTHSDRDLLTLRQ